MNVYQTWKIYNILSKFTATHAHLKQNEKKYIEFITEEKKGPLGNWQHLVP